MSLKWWFLWAFILICQNYAFTFVSRARNSGSLIRHLVAALASNGVWFVSQILIFTQLFAILTGKYGILKAVLTAIYYTVFTVTGSILAHYHSLRNEKGSSAVGANKKYAQITVEEWEAIKKRAWHDEDGSVPEKEITGGVRKKLGSNPKDIQGERKVALSLVPPVSLLHCAMAMMDGARKYGPYNWRKNNVQAMIYASAAKRHLEAWIDGEELAPDSLAHHLGHGMACLAILLDAQESGNLIDNRPVKGSFARVAARLAKQLRKKDREVRRAISARRRC